MKLSELIKKDIVNIQDGKKIGKITDVIFDINNGYLIKFIIESPNIIKTYSKEAVISRALKVPFKAVNEFTESLYPWFLHLGKGELNIVIYEDLIKLFQGQNNKPNDFLTFLLDYYKT